ncbi:MAG: ABC transporter substrate-binding protein [Myxococcota bacterium]|nr:ABC transporter substrate-binding protein [Myxococcota bacterium]
MKAELLNGALLLTALAGSVAGAMWAAPPAAEVTGSVSTAQSTAALTEVVDGRGIAVPVADYQRIVSLHMVADHLLLELVEPSRLVAITEANVAGNSEGWRFSAQIPIGQNNRLEAILRAQPDLVIVSNFVDAALLARLEEEGIPTFDLGGMYGLESTREDIRLLSQLVGAPARGDALLRSLDLQERALELAVPPDQRIDGIYLSVIGDAWYGGTQGTSYGDMLRLSGIHDVAADAGHQMWPRYSAEDLLALDPPLILAPSGSTPTICRHSILEQLRACHEGGRIVELPPSYPNDPGLGVLKTAQELQPRVHPRSPQ